MALRPLIRSLAAAAILIFATGCGTGANFSRHHTWAFGTPVTPYPIPYGGVAANVKLAVDRPEMAHFAAVDLCLCLVSDTLTLPWVVKYHIREIAERIDPKEEVANPIPPVIADPARPAPVPMPMLAPQSR